MRITAAWLANVEQSPHEVPSLLPASAAHGGAGAGMRQASFRILAGLISIGYAWTTYMRPPDLIDVPGKLSEMAIFAMFAVYAVIGNRLAAAAVPLRSRRE